MSRWTERHKQILALGIIVSVFVASRIAAYHAGVRFDASTLRWYWQFLDPVLLRERLFESLYYLHIQPPFFNLLLGVNLKLFPASFSAAMHAQYLAMGLAATIALFVLLCQLGIPRLMAAILASLFAVTPPMILYENWLFYEYPTMLFLLVAAVALHRFLSRDSVAAGAAFFAAAAAAIFTRTVFQVWWLVPIVGTLLLVKPPRLVLRCCAVPVILVLLLYVKNAALFGAPLTSSWVGLHFTRPTISQLDRQTRMELVAAGELHDVSSIDPFAYVDAYAKVVPPAAPTGIPVLDQSIKSTGSQNFNAKSYIAISREYFGDALWVVRHRPDIYFRSVREALVLYMSPSTDYPFVDENRRHILAYDRFANERIYMREEYLARAGLGIVGVYATAVMYGFLVLVQIAWRRRNPGPAALTVLFMVFTAVYSTALSCLTEVGENQRQRFFLDPLVFAVVAAGLWSLVLWTAGGIRRLYERAMPVS